MNDLLRKAAARSLGWAVRLLARGILFVGEDPRCRRRLGQAFALMRQGAHENYAGEVRARYEIHPKARLSPETFIFGDGQIQIGEGTYLGRLCFVAANPADARIEIGRSCAISHSVHIRTAAYRTEGNLEDAMSSELQWADVKIGNSVWIGAHAFIRGGVTVGDNAVIGANSVVTRNVPANAIVGGVPAKVLRFKESASKHGAPPEPAP